MSISIFKLNNNCYHIYDSYGGGLWEFNLSEIKLFLTILDINQKKKILNHMNINACYDNKYKLAEINDMISFIENEEITQNTTFAAKAVIDRLNYYDNGIITAPFTIIEVSRLCNYNCYWCFLDYKDPKVDVALSLNDLIKFVVDPMIDIGSIHWGITGGEPSLTLEKTLKLSKYIKEVTIRKFNLEPNIMLFTNGHYLSKNAILYKDAGISTVHVSLSSANEEQELKLRRPPKNENSYLEVINGIKECKKIGLNVNLNSVIINDIGYGSNINTMPLMYELANTLDVDLFDLNLACPSGEAKRNCITFSKKDYKKITLNEQRCSKRLKPFIKYCCATGNLEENRDISCGSGIIEFYVDYIGNTFPCNNLTDDSLKCDQQTVKEKSIESIWFNSEILRQLRQYDKFFVNDECGKCIYRGFCVGSCIARIWHQYGLLNLNKRPEYCYLNEFEKEG